MDDLQALLEKIRRNVVAEAEQRFADETFQHLRHSIHNGRMHDADSFGCLAGEQGETMEMYLRFRNSRVEKATYLTDGEKQACLCGSCVAELAIGKTPRQLLELRASDVLKRVCRGGDGVEKAALLAVEALHKAVEHFWLTHNGEQAATAAKKRNPRFIAVGSGYNHMQYLN